MKRPCKACQKRKKASQAREALLTKRASAKRAKGQTLSAKMDEAQAAAVGAFLAVTEAVGQSLGIGEDTEDERERRADQAGSERAGPSADEWR